MAGGHEVPITWRNRRATAWVPDRLADRDLELPAGIARRTEQAAASVVRSDDRLPLHWEPLARLLLRAEGIASSNIEGLRAPAVEVVAAELDRNFAGETPAWIADNLDAVTEALDEARKAPLTVAALHRWHVSLMRHSLLPDEMIGAFRTAQGWIGGPSPLDAAFVPPPPELVPSLMEDLVAFVNRDELDPITVAAVTHAQFETVHPYGDGNGRIGRMLIGWVLVRRLHVRVPPPVSVLIARDIGGYLSGLTRFRTESASPWVDWVAAIVQRAGEATSVLVAEVEQLLALWLESLSDVRSDATARRVLALLPSNPVLSGSVVAAELGVSTQAARVALDALAERGVLEPLALRSTRPGRPPKLWYAPALLDQISRWSG